MKLVFLQVIFSNVLKILKQGWKVNLVDYNEGTAGGYKEIIFEVNGENVYGTTFESGVHRVQRVPQTETQGRVHTSAATVTSCRKLKNLMLS